MPNELWVISQVVLWCLVIAEGVGLLAIFYYLGSLVRNSTAGRSQQGPKVGRHLRSQSFSTLRGESVELPFPGQSSLIFLLATHCDACRELLPELRELAQHAERSMPAVKLAAVVAGQRSEIATFADGLSSSLVVIVDERHRLASQLDIAVTPFCVGVDQTGMVRLKDLVNAKGGPRMAYDDLLTAGKEGRDGNGTQYL